MLQSTKHITSYIPTFNKYMVVHNFNDTTVPKLKDLHQAVKPRKSANTKLKNKGLC